MQVLTWSAYLNNAFAANRIARTQTATYDPESNAITTFTVTNTNHDMFCPGITMLGSGDIVVTGGDNAEKTSIYKPGDGWVPGPDMKIPRGYQASALTSDGLVRTSLAVMASISCTQHSCFEQRSFLCSSVCA